jgi:hypothetical protein
VQQDGEGQKENTEEKQSVSREANEKWDQAADKAGGIPIQGEEKALDAQQEENKGNPAGGGPDDPTINQIL